MRRSSTRARDPMDCCFSGFKQFFAEGQEVYLRSQRNGALLRPIMSDLMDHWDEVLPGKGVAGAARRCLDDLEGQTRRMLDFLGLPASKRGVSISQDAFAVRGADRLERNRCASRSTAKGRARGSRFEPWLDELKSGARRPYARRRLGEPRPRPAPSPCGAASTIAPSPRREKPSTTTCDSGTCPIWRGGKFTTAITLATDKGVFGRVAVGDLGAAFARAR